MQLATNGSIGSWRRIANVMAQPIRECMRVTVDFTGKPVNVYQAIRSPEQAFNAESRSSRYRNLLVCSQLADINFVREELR